MTFGKTKYSISEIDELRSLVSRIHSAGWQSYHTSQVEEEVRTYMLNGTTVEELRLHVEEVEREWEEARG